MSTFGEFENETVIDRYCLFKCLNLVNFFLKLNNLISVWILDHAYLNSSKIFHSM